MILAIFVWTLRDIIGLIALTIGILGFLSIWIYVSISDWRANRKARRNLK